MLVRSQDKTLLINLDKVEAMHVGRYEDGYRIIFYLKNLVENNMGVYSTQMQALTVLDMIQSTYLQPKCTNNITENEAATYEDKVFEMPEECEVSSICFKLK